MSTLTEILVRSDNGEHPGEIAEALDVTPGRVYAVLRQHRPNRKRKPRRRTSEKPAQIRALAAKGIKQGRIADLLDVTRQYVSKELR